MAIQNDSALKSYFNAGDKPSAQDFADLIDSKATNAALTTHVNTLNSRIDNLGVEAGNANAEVTAARTAINYGTAPASLSDALRYAALDFVNVKAYGAVGDGTTDDTAAVDAAVAAAGESKMIFFPPGTYKYDNSIDLADVRGLYAYPGMTVLKYNGASGTYAVDCTAAGAVEHRLLHGIYVEFVTATNTRHGFNLANVRRASVENCYVFKANYGFHLNYSIDTQIQNCKSDFCTVGIYAEAINHAITVTKHRFVDAAPNTNVGLRIGSADAFAMYGCNFQNTATAIDVVGRLGQVLVSGTYFETNLRSLYCNHASSELYSLTFDNCHFGFATPAVCVFETTASAGATNLYQFTVRNCHMDGAIDENNIIKWIAGDLRATIENVVRTNIASLSGTYAAVNADWITNKASQGRRVVVMERNVVSSGDANIRGAWQFPADYARPEFVNGFSVFDSRDSTYAQVRGYNLTKRVTKEASAAPTSGAYLVGDIVWNTVPTAGGTIGWVCITAGTPGTWKAFGTIAA